MQDELGSLFSSTILSASPSHCEGLVYIILDSWILVVHIFHHHYFIRYHVLAIPDQLPPMSLVQDLEMWDHVRRGPGHFRVYVIFLL